ncbi:immunity 26/phosphotriesterase HocA family protein [Parasediminibacterium sp. JCM 36343]|uniref:immunity 26/phosphotriesterase HocA family protein n=1 Tax=Parasediminibacterium sp. JCM 36343 TaxID=3374279 RepID=UPI0039791838
MTTFELTNNQREYFGLDPIQSNWEKVLLKGDKYRPESILYFEGEKIKRHIVSNDKEYSETHYDELTKDRTILLPKTDKGKEKKLTASVLEQRSPMGIYLSISKQDLTIGNYNTQTTFYSSRWGKHLKLEQETIPQIINKFIDSSPENHFTEISEYKNAKRKNIKFKSGDYFCFKLDRINFGFGKLLLDVGKIIKKQLITNYHGLGFFMGQPLIVQLFAYKSTTKNVDISILDCRPKLPSDVMFDNLLLYGEYEIIGHRKIEEEEFDFPISYGKSIDQRRIVFLQWGLIHKELPKEKFYKYVVGDKGEFDNNPYGYYSLGFRPHYDTIEIAKAIDNNGVYDFSNSWHYKAKWDLRNPRNQHIKEEIFKEFGLDPTKSYVDNCKITGTQLTTDLIKQIDGK